MQSTSKNIKDIYVIMEEGEQDYGQFCILDEELAVVKWVKPVSHNGSPKPVYGLFEKALYIISVFAIFIVIVRYV